MSTTIKQLTEFYKTSSPIKTDTNLLTALWVKEVLEVEFDYSTVPLDEPLTTQVSLCFNGKERLLLGEGHNRYEGKDITITLPPDVANITTHGEWEIWKKMTPIADNYTPQVGDKVLLKKVLGFNPTWVNDMNKFDNKICTIKALVKYTENSFIILDDLEQYYFIPEYIQKVYRPAHLSTGTEPCVDILDEISTLPITNSSYDGMQNTLKMTEEASLFNGASWTQVQPIMRVSDEFVYELPDKNKLIVRKPKKEEQTTNKRITINNFKLTVK